MHRPGGMTPVALEVKHQHGVKHQQGLISLQESTESPVSLCQALEQCARRSREQFVCRHTKRARRNNGRCGHSRKTGVREQKPCRGRSVCLSGHAMSLISTVCPCSSVNSTSNPFLHVLSDAMAEEMHLCAFCCWFQPSTRHGPTSLTSKPVCLKASTHLSQALESSRMSSLWSHHEVHELWKGSCWTGHSQIHPDPKADGFTGCLSE